jgi:molybdopterin-guanine dinucleotide biosynthesis protein A
MQPTTPLSAYVLAGGRSSRMGTDKAVLQLAGKPLVEHAVDKLRRITPHVHILSSNPILADYAPLLPDIHSNTGPIGGIEAALTYTTTDWNLFLPVDMPFLSTAFLRSWLDQTLTQPNARIHLIRTADNRPQPGLCLLHREICPHLAQSIVRGEYKLMQAFQTAAAEIATRTHLPPTTILSITPINHHSAPLSLHQQAAQHLWFTNLNTPDDLAQAEAHLEALDR